MHRDSSIEVSTQSSIPLWRDERILKAVVQIVSALIAIGFIIFFIKNVLQAAEARGLNLGYEFLDQTAGMPLSESVIPYDESKTFAYAFLVGILNTLKVASIGIVLATLLGVIAALGRLSTNWLVAKIASVYIETIRNVPLLVQLIIWYEAVFKRLPLVKESIKWPGPTYLSQRGLYLPSPNPTSTFGMWAGFVTAGVVLAIILRIWLGRHQLRTGRATYPVLTATLVLLALPTLGWLLAGESPLIKEVPVMGKFNLTGGMRLTPEYAALLTGLVVYTGAFIAEVVRAGILAVDKGQFEAARAIGLNNLQVLRLVVFPQAMRVIIPPLISQYLNLAKNSSLAIVVGYLDVFYVGRTIINQAGRAVPVFSMIMASYLFVSLVTSLLMNDYNRYIQREPTLTKRAINVIRLNVNTLKELAHDPDAETQVSVMLVVVALLVAIDISIIGLSYRYPVGGLIGISILAFVNLVIVGFVNWFLLSISIWALGTWLFDGKATLNQMLRLVGFANAPLLLGGVWVGISAYFIPKTPAVILLFFFLTSIVVLLWTLVTLLVAVQEGLDLDKAKACFIIIAGFVFSGVCLSLLEMLISALETVLM